MNATATARVLPLRRPVASPAQGEKTIADGVRLVLTTSAAAGLSPRTMVLYERNLGRFATFCQDRGVTLLQDVTPDTILDFFAYLRAGGALKPATIRTVGIVIRRMFMLAERRRWLTENPWRAVTLPRAAHVMKPPFAAFELEALLKAAWNGRQPWRDIPLLLFMLDSGLRVQELVDLRVGDVDAGGMVQVRSGKGGESRTVFIGAATLEWWQQHLKGRHYPPPTAPAWESYGRAEGITARGIRDWCRRLAARSGVKNVHPHRFRRTFAVKMLLAGCDVVRLRRFMGHAKGSNTLETYYLPLVTGDLAEAHKQFGPVNTLHLGSGGR